MPPDGSAQQAALGMLRVLGPERTGITWANRIVEDSLANYFTYTNMYNGGGVACGDLDGDGRPDLVFTSNRNGGAVYRNDGDLHFTDVTKTAGFDISDMWAQGVTLVDANADGRMDIHVCGDGPGEWPEATRRNRLYINQGGMKFVDEAAARGLASTGHDLMGYFGDLDGDGDLDLFQVGHRIDFQDMRRAVVDPRYLPVPDQTNRLYINDGNGFFSDRTQEAGVMSRRFGLGAALGDLDGDMRTDIYTTNDFYTADMMLINDGPRGPDRVPNFTDRVLERMRHITYFAMGVDRADINNDGAAEIFELDMTPLDHKLSKENMASMRPRQFADMVKHGMHRQYMINTLQLNLGNGHYQEIAQLAGVDKTDWSWAPLFVDLDNDGWKDLYVTNGIRRDIANADFRTRVTEIAMTQGTDLYFKPILDLAPTHLPEKVVLRNNGADAAGRPTLTFQPMMDAWGYHHASVATGAAYADLDSDGDMDLVTVETDQPCKVVENRSMQIAPRGYLQLVLKGGPNNPGAIGSKATVHTESGMQVNELWLGRGYQSSVEPLLHFGLGDATVDSVVIDWYDGTRSTLVAPAQNERMAVDMQAQIRRPSTAAPLPDPLFIDMAAANGLDHRHRESVFNDFDIEPLLPHCQSQHGPACAVADVDGNGTEDVFMGSSSGSSAVLFLQDRSGRFARAAGQPWAEHKAEEFIGACFFDADGDSDKDLYLASGSTEFPESDPRYADHLFLNNGRGNFSEAPGAVPDIRESSGCAVAHDIDADGDLDLFVGGRNVAGFYPASPVSRVLINQGGRFTDATATWLPNEGRLGMVNGAVFVDTDGDKREELIVASEWQPLRMFRNTGQLLAEDPTGRLDTTMVGWWQGLHAADVDGDGDVDLLAGNIGLNNKFHPTREHPLKVYSGDLDGNGRNDIVLAKTDAGSELPVRGRECSSEQCPMILQKFPTYKQFAAAALQDIYGAEALQRALSYSATEFRSMLMMNDGHGRFVAEPLPVQAQTAPARSFVVSDLNGDARMDIVVAGNLYCTEVETVSYDAGVGLVLLGSQEGWLPQSVHQSGVFVPHDTRHVLSLAQAGRIAPGLLFVNNNGPVQWYLPTHKARTAPVPGAHL